MTQAASPKSSGTSSPVGSVEFNTMAGVLEKPFFEINVGNIFSWGDLHAGLSGYLKTLQSIVEADLEEQVFKGLPLFCKELEVYLGDAESQKLDARNELTRWKEKGEKMIAEEEDLAALDIPEIHIVEKK